MVGDLLDDLDGDAGGGSDAVGVVGDVGEGELDEGEDLREAFKGGTAPSRLSLSETLYGWRAWANRVMLMPNGRCSHAAVVGANWLMSLKSAA